jgi:rhamnopyranosyl-N-acetylglucosaminyl-diphospho-decaprenol beta-1,3/1,4-galactofuranosyltransferase
MTGTLTGPIADPLTRPIHTPINGHDAIKDAGRGTHDTPGALCGAVNEFGDIALRHRRRYHLPTGIERALPRAAYDGPPCRIDTASFVGFLVSAAAIAEVGMPERAFFLAYDDTEYSLRLRRAGMSLWLVPDSVVEHLRSRRSRLRAGPFGAKHYFTIRNRIAVARTYATLPLVATAVALLFALALWLGSAGRLRRGALRILLGAVRDGMRRRLGPFPAALARLQRRPGPAQVSAGTGPGRA